MDLRNRDNFAEIIQNLRGVPSSRFRDSAERIASLAQQDTRLETEIANHLTQVYQREVARKANANGSFSELSCRIHVFDMKDEQGESLLRIDAAELPGMTHGQYHMSDFVSKIDVKLFPSGETVSWSRGQGAVDGITVSRQNIAKAEILVHVDYEHALFSVPRELRHDVAFCNVTNIFKLICGHIKKNHLSSDDDPSYFTPDAVLHKLLYPSHPANHPVSFASLLDVIKSHFKRPGPFKIDYEIKEAMQEKVCEIVVQVPHKFDPQVLTLIRDNEAKLHDTLLKLDEEIASSSSGIESLGFDAVFLEKVATNPIAQLLEILNRPTGVVRDVQSIGKVDYTNMATTSDFYKQPWAVPAAAFVVGGAKEAPIEQTRTTSRRR